MVYLLVDNVMASIKIAKLLWSLEGIKGKGKITSIHAIKGHSGCRCKALLILSLDTNWR